jgi:hypothetical protein
MAIGLDRAATMSESAEGRVVQRANRPIADAEGNVVIACKCPPRDRGEPILREDERLVTRITVAIVNYLRRRCL